MEARADDDAAWTLAGLDRRRARRVLALTSVGFFITAFVFLGGLFLLFGVSRRWIVPLAVVVTFALHVAFYTVLRVPLPWGWLEGMAW